MARPFARTFDLIAEQYGWTDDQILDLTMGRMRQVREVVWERKAEERRRFLLVKQFELRTLASFMAQSQEAANTVQDIVLVAPEDDVAPEQKMIPYETARRMFGG